MSVTNDNGYKMLTCYADSRKQNSGSVREVATPQNLRRCCTTYTMDRVHTAGIVYPFCLLGQGGALQRPVLFLAWNTM